jgi:hypothetical protein
MFLHYMDFLFCSIIKHFSTFLLECILFPLILLIMTMIYGEDIVLKCSFCLEFIADNGEGTQGSPDD